MLVVGITGGIGSGKGLATEFFRSRGAAVIDADEIARELTRPGTRLLEELARAFGRHVLRDDGSLDRRRLSRAAFRDSRSVERLNALTHPSIKAEIRRRLAALAGEGRRRIVCLVAPLLLEAGCEEFVDRLLVVAADERERIRRVVARDGLTEEEVRQRMAVQICPEEQRRRADWVLDTGRGQADVCRQLEDIWQELIG